MIHDLHPYPRMKDSGVPWLGQVPEHWDLRRTKTLLRERSQKGFPNEPMLAATQTKGVVRKEEYENRTVLALKDLHLLKLVKKGDFVISLRSFQGGIEFAREQGIISPAYTILFPVDSGNHGYLAALFKSQPYIENLTLFVTGIRQGQNIDYEKLSRSEIPLPPSDEQAAIVRFLDHADRRIRKAIAAKQKLIRLLQEQKQVIIHQAVTRGLDPKVKLKPSGVEWLGDVPERWEVRRCKYVFAESDTRSEQGSELHLSMSQKLGLVPSSLVERTLISDSYAGGKLCQEGDLVLNRLKAHLGVFASSKYDGVISPDYSVFKPVAGANTKYFELLLKSPGSRRELFVRARGIVEGFWRLYTEDFYDIYVPFPPVEEQEAIVQHIEEEGEKLDQAVARAQAEIALLREYRTRLIADVVTGKLDVQGAAAQLPEPEPDTVPEEMDGEGAEDTEGLEEDT